MLKIQKGIFFIKKYLYALKCCFYLFFLGFALKTYRPMISIICNYFNFGLIPKIEIAEIISNKDYIELHEIIAADGNITNDELIIINSLIKQHSPKRIFEIGTFDGRTTLNMAANSPKEVEIITLDLPKELLHYADLELAPGENRFIDKCMSGSRFQGKKEGKKITKEYGDSANFDFTRYYNTMDFIFIDGSHAYEYVLNDSLKAYQILNDHGVILWHDYTVWEGVTRALNELFLRNSLFKNLRHIKGTSIVCLIK
jgi:predicted O-methyltransferase YrrM